MRLIEESATEHRIARIYREGRIFPIYTVVITDRASGAELYRRPVLSRRLAREVATIYSDSRIPDNILTSEQIDR